MPIEIELNQNEFAYLCKASFLPDRFRKLFFSSVRKKKSFLLNISEEQADEIRDLCGDQLQLVGFDERYEPTTEGLILESLMDKFYVE
jgi:hypothetical protein